MIKKFALADLVAVTTAVVVTEDGVEGFYRIFKELAGTSVLTHELVAACDTFGPMLLALYPWLHGLEVPQNSTTYADTIGVWLANLREEHGDEFEVETDPFHAVWARRRPALWKDLADARGVLVQPNQNRLTSHKFLRRENR